MVAAVLAAAVVPTTTAVLRRVRRRTPPTLPGVTGLPTMASAVLIKDNFGESAMGNSMTSARNNTNRKASIDRKLKDFLEIWIRQNDLQITPPGQQI